MSSIIKPVLGSQLELGHPLSGGLVGCWLFNEGTGNKVFDLSGNRNHGTGVTALVWGSGKFGPSLQFGGAGDRFKIDDGFSTAGWTIIFWAKPINITANQYVTDGNLKRSVLLGFQNNYWNIYNYPTGTDTDSQMLAIANVWQQVAYTTDNVTTQGYINGKLQIDVVGASPIPSDNYYYVGATDVGSSAYTGQIDNMLIYNRVSIASEIALLYREPFIMFERNPIELWVGSVGAGAPPGTILPQITSAYMKVSA